MEFADKMRELSGGKPVGIKLCVGYPHELFAIMKAMLATGIPLLFSDGLTGLAIGIGVGSGVALVVRAWYVSQMFEGFVFIRHALRAVLPTVPAVAIVFGLLVIGFLIRAGERRREAAGSTGQQVEKPPVRRVKPARFKRR